MTKKNDDDDDDDIDDDAIYICCMNKFWCIANQINVCAKFAQTHTTRTIGQRTNNTKTKNKNNMRANVMLKNYRKFITVTYAQNHRRVQCHRFNIAPTILSEQEMEVTLSKCMYQINTNIVLNKIHKTLCISSLIIKCNRIAIRNSKGQI